MQINEAQYLASNPDVAAAVRAGQFTSGLQHFQLHGRREGRVASGLTGMDAVRGYSMGGFNAQGVYQTYNELAGDRGARGGVNAALVNQNARRLGLNIYANEKTEQLLGLANSKNIYSATKLLNKTGISGLVDTTAQAAFPSVFGGAGQVYSSPIGPTVTGAPLEASSTLSASGILGGAGIGAAIGSLNPLVDNQKAGTISGGIAGGAAAAFGASMPVVGLAAFAASTIFGGLGSKPHPTSAFATIWSDDYNGKSGFHHTSFGSKHIGDEYAQQSLPLYEGLVKEVDEFGVNLGNVRIRAGYGSKDFYKHGFIQLFDEVDGAKSDARVEWAYNPNDKDNIQSIHDAFQVALLSRKDTVWEDRTKQQAVNDMLVAGRSNREVLDMLRNWKGSGTDATAESVESYAQEQQQKDVVVEFTNKVKNAQDQIQDFINKTKAGEATRNVPASQKSKYERGTGIRSTILTTNQGVAKGEESFSRPKLGGIY